MLCPAADDEDCSERYCVADVVVYDVACPERSLVQHRKLELEELCFELRTGIGGMVAPLWIFIYKGSLLNTDR